MASCGLGLVLLGAIAAPMQAQDTSGAQSLITDLTKAQQSFYSKNRGFTNSITTLARAFKIQTPSSYSYAIRTTTRSAYQYVIPKASGGKAYVSGVFVDATPNSRNTLMIVCEAENTGGTRPADPAYVRGILRCGTGTKVVDSSQPIEPQ